MPNPRRQRGTAIFPGSIRVGRLLATALLYIALPAAAETITGTVVDGNDGTPVPDAEVAFFVSENDQVTEIVRKTTDAEGRFSFSGPFLTPDLTFVLVALHHGIPYPSSELRADGQTEIILEVFEPSNDAGNLHIPSHAIIIGGSGGHTIEVSHFVQIDNRGLQTYVGSGSGNDRRVAEFALPAGLFNLSGSLGAAGDDRFFDNRPLPPGLTQISFTFQLDPGDLDDGYLHRAVYGTDALELYVQPDLSGTGSFEDLGTTDLHGVEYRHLRAAGLQAGQQMIVPLELPPEVGWTLKWVALAATFALGALTFAVRPTGGHDRPPVGDRPSELDTTAGAQQYRILLQQVADLDDGHVAAPGDAGYLRQREALLCELVTLRRRAAGR